jgi:hypothetical protein
MGSLVLTGVPAGLIAAHLRYTGAGKLYFDVRDKADRRGLYRKSHSHFEGFDR